MNILLIGRATPRIVIQAGVPVTRYIHALAYKFTEMGHEVDVMCSHMPNTRKQRYGVIEVGNLRLLKLLSQNWYELYFGMKVGWALRKLKQNYDVVHFLESPSSAFFSLLFNPFRKTPFMFSSGRPIDNFLRWHNQGASDTVKFTTNFMHSFVSKHMDRVMTSSKALKRSLVKNLNTNGHKITVAPFITALPNLFYPQPKDERLMESLRIKETDNVVLCIGEVSQYKNQLAIIRAIPDVIKEKPDTKFLFVGGINEGYYEILHAFINRFGVEDKVIFTGHKRVGDLPKYYNLADVFVLLSEAEGNLPQTVIDAMCCNIPVIVSNLLQNSEWAGNSIQYVNPHFPFGVAKKITDTISKGTWYNTSQGKAEKAVLEQHSAENVAGRILRVYGHKP